jgi:hypothetical protein
MPPAAVLRPIVAQRAGGETPVQRGGHVGVAANRPVHRAAVRRPGGRHLRRVRSRS